MFRSGGSAVLRRFLQEQQAGRIVADVLTTSDPAATAGLAKKGIFVPFSRRISTRAGPSQGCRRRLPRATAQHDTLYCP